MDLGIDPHLIEEQQFLERAVYIAGQHWPEVYCPLCRIVEAQLQPIRSRRIIFKIMGGDRWLDDMVWSFMVVGLARIGEGSSPDAAGSSTPVTPVG